MITRTPKEKAYELLDIMFRSSPTITVEQAKECALIAMDEIIASNTNVTGQTLNGDYWLEVKQEIEKL
jgi:hypothetical protein